jgi:hypothetical protein
LNKNQNEQGKRRSVWLPASLDAKAEEARIKLGLGRSGFYRYAIVEVIKQLCQGSRSQGDWPLNDADKLAKVKELLANLERESQEARAILLGILDPSQKNEHTPFLLPEDLAEKVTIETTPTELIIRPKAFLGPEIFKDINSLVRRFNGYYVSSGKDSHFIVPKPK